MVCITDPVVLRKAAVSRHQYRFYFSGQFILPCVPSLIEDYLEQFQRVFTALGRQFSEADLEQLRQIVAKCLVEGYTASTHANLILDYRVDANTGGINYTARTEIGNVAGQYQGWIRDRPAPLFRNFPDAKALHVAAKLESELGADPLHILEIGPGTGRNTIPLARRGYHVDAVEITPEFAEQIQAAAIQESLSINVQVGNFLDPLVRFRLRHYHLAYASEVVAHLHDLDELRLLFAKVADYLIPGGLFLFNTFLPIAEYLPEPVIKELSMVHCCMLFTKAEIYQALDGLPLQYVMDEPQLKYEQQHQKPEDWENLGWFGLWSSGRGLFDLPEGQEPPMELCWLILQRI